MTYLDDPHFTLPERTNDYIGEFRAVVASISSKLSYTFANSPIDRETTDGALPYPPDLGSKNICKQFPAAETQY